MEASTSTKRRRPREHRHPLPGDLVVVLAEDEIVEVVEHVEGREQRQETDDHAEIVEQEVSHELNGTLHPPDFRVLRQRALVDRADGARRRTVPTLVRRDDRSRRDGRQVADLGAVADGDIVADDVPVTDVGVLADHDSSDVNLVADDLHVGELALGAEAASGADGDEVDGTFLELVNDGVAPDLRSEAAQIDAHQRRALEELVGRQLHQALHQPEAEIVRAPERIDARPGTADDQPLHRHHDDLRAEVQRDIDAGQNQYFQQ